MNKNKHKFIILAYKVCRICKCQLNNGQEKAPGKLARSFKVYTLFNYKTIYAYIAHTYLIVLLITKMVTIMSNSVAGQAMRAILLLKL